MTRPTFRDSAMIGRTMISRGSAGRARGLDALIPTSPTPAPVDVRRMQWKQLEGALFALTNAQLEYEHNGDVEAGRMQVEDCRRALGALALSLADDVAAEGYARLFGEIMAAPTGRRQ